VIGIDRIFRCKTCKDFKFLAGFAQGTHDYFFAKIAKEVEN